MLFVVSMTLMFENWIVIGGVQSGWNVAVNESEKSQTTHFVTAPRLPAPDKGAHLPRCAWNSQSG
jgi:hypothetical protein